MIHQVEKLPKGNVVYIYIECEDLDNKVKEVVAKGIHFKKTPNDMPWL